MQSLESHSDPCRKPGMRQVNGVSTDLFSYTTHLIEVSFVQEIVPPDQVDEENNCRLKA